MDYNDYEEIIMDKTPSKVEYVIYECPYCHGKMSFKREPRNRTVETVCAKCGKELKAVIK